MTIEKLPHEKLFYPESENLEVGVLYEISEEDWDYFFNVLPPMQFQRMELPFIIRFFMSEFETENITRCFIQVWDKFFFKLCDYRQELPVRLFEYAEYVRQNS